MPATIPTTTSTGRPASPSLGDAYFETDTKDYIIYDGSSWRSYIADGVKLAANSYSLALDGTDDRVELGSVAGLASSSAFSLSCWFKSSSSATEYLWSTGTTFYEGIHIYTTSSGIFFVVGKGGSAYSGRSIATNYRDGSWHHVAATFDGSTLLLYVDGSSGGSTTGTSAPSTSQAGAGGNCQIGYRYDDNDTYAWTGSVDDFTIYNDTLTSAEVSNVYTSAVYNLNKVSHLYRFENDYTDSQGSNNGTAQGDPTFDSGSKPY